MAGTPREYELVLMLDPGRDAPGRDAIAQEARAKIEADGTLKHENEWGLRKLAYEINQRTEADYRWFRFEASNELLDQLNHSLKITDGVLRFRIFKVDPEAPVIVPPAAGTAPASRDRHDDGEDAEPQAAAEPEAAKEPVSTAPPEGEEPAVAEVAAEAPSSEAGGDSGEPDE